MGIKGLSEVEGEHQHCDEIHQQAPKKGAKASRKRKRVEFLLGDHQGPTHRRDRDKKQNLVPEEVSSPQAAVVPKIEELGGGAESDTEHGGKEETERLGVVVERAHNSLGENLECPYCPKVFASSFGLKRHATIHENKRFKCDICEKLLSRKDNLLAHKRNVHGWEMFKTVESETHEPLSKDATVEQLDALKPDD